jgi:predicted Zn finger-like uncharacterized protein
MSDITSCPQCQRKLRVTDELMGQAVQCPSCGHVFTAAAEKGAAPEPPPAPPPPEREPPDKAVQPRRRPMRVEDDYDERDDYDDEYPRRRRRREYEPHRGATILVFGILAFFICGIIFGPIAWAMGSGDLRKIREGRMDPEGEGLTKAGMICGIIATCLTIVGCVIYALVLALMGAGGAFRH